MFQLFSKLLERKPVMPHAAPTLRPHNSAQLMAPNTATKKLDAGAAHLPLWRLRAWLGAALAAETPCRMQPRTPLSKVTALHPARGGAEL